jgi:uncharacterized membrane protein YbhN (UPF0104 family)
MQTTTHNHTLPTPRLTLRIARSIPVLLLVGLAVHLLLPQITALEHSLQVIRQMALWAVGLAVLAQVLSYAGSGYLLRALVAVAGQTLTMLRGTLITLAGSSIGLVAGGMVGNAAAVYRWLRGSGIERDGALLAGWLPSLLNNGLLLLVSLVGMLHLLLVHELSTAQAVGFGFTLAVILAAVGGILWGVGHRAAFVSLLTGVSRWGAGLLHRPYSPATPADAAERVFSAWDALRAGGWRGPALGTLLNLGFDMLTLYCLFFAARHPVSFGVLLAGYGLPLLLGKAAFFLPGGVGIIEGTMAALYNGLGVPPGVTVVVILGYRVLSFWIPTLLGFPLVIYLQRTTHSGDGG